jgi:uncharacterized repeat protein (TIGR03803 family)
MKTHPSIQTFHFVFLIWLVLAGVFLAPTAGAAVDFEVVKALGQEGGNPQSALIKDAAGNLYGTTFYGGSYGAGTVFKVDTTGNTTVLHEFDGDSGGANPSAGLVLGSDGNFYGTTQNGGGTGFFGTVFKLDPAGNFTVLHRFEYSDIYNDGVAPYAGLIQGSDGNFYGTTFFGGSYAHGTVYKIDSSGNYTVLHSFDDSTSGYPQAELIQGDDGSFYGTTSSGGSYGAGMIFKLDSSGNLTVLHSFDGGNGGEGPSSRLVQGSDGSFYGTTTGGGTVDQGNENGIVFKLDPSGNFTVLHDFDSGSGGAQPTAGLIQGIDGNFYGTTTGSIYSFGTLFKIDSSGNFNVIFSFNGTDGAAPQAELLQDSNGNFFGTTSKGGNNDEGAVFKLDSNGNFSLLHSFGFDYGIAANPVAGLIEAPDGSFYGTSVTGGEGVGGANLGYGTVFRLDPSGDLSVLHSFEGDTDGAHPRSELLMGSDGNFYGTTDEGGSNNAGTVFKIDASGNFNILHDFDGGSEGMTPEAPLIQGSDGKFYGITVSGGNSGAGIVFQIDASGNFSVLHHFDGGAGGAAPRGELIQGNDGSFYGTTYYGGSNNAGTIFKLTSSGNFTVLHSFDGGSGGAYSLAGLVQASDGNFYGTTSAGGSSGSLGTIFKLSSSGQFSILYKFVGPLKGVFPHAGLIQGSNGSLYGTTNGGGTYGLGVVFKLDLSGNFSVLHEFEIKDGYYPEAKVIQASDGGFYGTTNFGGPNGGGSIFRLVETSNATLITLTSSLNPSAVGQSVTFTATVSGDNPTGTVEFFVGTTSLGSRTLNNGVAALSTPRLVAGTHSITAVYSGDANNASSTSAAVTQVVKAKSSTSLTSRPNPSRAGAPVTFTATVKGKTPTGTVEFLDGTASLGTATVGSTGKAKLSTSALSKGLHRISARYSGDGNNAASTSAVLRQTVR